MTPYELKYQHMQSVPNSHFFDRRTMSFFGDTMRNYGVRTTTIQTMNGAADVYELCRKRPVKHGLRASSYFDKTTFKQVRICIPELTKTA